MGDNAINRIKVLKIEGSTLLETEDQLAIEEPLEIRLRYGPLNHRETKSISVTMRTPGNDEDLVRGFLLTENIIKHNYNLKDIHLLRNSSQHIVVAEMQPDYIPDLKKLERNFYTSSSCGVCGKTSIEAVHQACSLLPTKDNIKIQAELLYTLPGKMNKNQTIFKHTGGLHACALFTIEGELAFIREDVGRHNAFDKVIGAAMQTVPLPMERYLAVLSGRASFELIQKALMAGIKIVAAVGAPSSLAVSIADESDMTLIGFLKGERCNIYTGWQRIVNLPHENTHKR